MEAEKNSIIYMGLIPGPNKTDEVCGKTMVTGTMHRGSTVCASVTSWPQQILRINTKMKEK
jgi:hypothetical protein